MKRVEVRQDRALVILKAKLSVWWSAFSVFLPGSLLCTPRQLTLSWTRWLINKDLASTTWMIVSWVYWYNIRKALTNLNKDSNPKSKLGFKREGMRRIRSSKIQQNVTDLLLQSKLKLVQSNLKVVMELGSSEEQTDTFWIFALI